MEVEKLYKLVDVEVLCGLMPVDILNDHVLIQLEAILNALPADGGEEGLHDLCDLPVVLAVLLEPRDPIGDLALLGGRPNSLLDSAHHLLHLLQSARQGGHCALIEDAESDHDRCRKFLCLGGRHIFEIRASLF